MQMTKEQEYRMISDELEWTKKSLQEKRIEVMKANERCQQALFRHDNTYKAIMAFIKANPEYEEPYMYKFERETLLKGKNNDDTN